MRALLVIINIVVGSFLQEWLNWVKQRGSKQVEKEVSETRLELPTHWSDAVLTPCQTSRMTYISIYAFVTDISLNVMCGSIMRFVCFQMSIWGAQGYHARNKRSRIGNAMIYDNACTSCNSFVAIYRCWTLPSAYTGTAAPPFCRRLPCQ